MKVSNWKKHALNPQSGSLLPERQCVPAQKGTGQLKGLSKRSWKSQSVGRAEGSEGSRGSPRCEGSEHPVPRRKTHGIIPGLLGRTVSVRSQ